MKRRLLLMRHAKSSWKNSEQSDHERPLNARGQRDAPAMGNLLKVLNLIPDKVILSDSTRTRDTFEHMWASMPDIEPVYAHNLYLGGLNDIVKHCSLLNEHVESALFLGHNPGFSQAAGWLSNTFVELKTAYIAVLEAEMVDGDWSSLMKPGAWTLTAVYTPQDGHQHAEVG